jgi:glutamate-1-semialdehyde 2,1-aminomutase
MMPSDVHQRPATGPIVKHPGTLRQSYSAVCHRRALSVIPQGVGSPGRAFSDVPAGPIFVSHAHGARLWDVDGNKLTDFVNGLGPIILGHGDDAVVEAITSQCHSGSVHALCSELEAQLAGMIASSTPEIEKVRFTCSGTEAVMTAIRLSRLITGRAKVVKFRGAYHGHADQVLAPPPDEGTRDPGRPVREGIPVETARQTIHADYNDVEGIRAIFDREGGDIAAVLVEPVATNMGLVPGTEEFLTTLRELCHQHAALLVCDEVVNGFRLRYGAYAQALQLDPDLYTFGKVIGGGLPIGALAGPSKHMDWMETHCHVFHSGTFASNPITMAAGVAVLKKLRSGEPYDHLEVLGAELENRVIEALEACNSPYGFIRRGSLFSLILVPGRKRLYNHSEVAQQDTALFATLHDSLLGRGFLLPPTIEEPGFLSNAHSVEDVRGLADAIGDLLATHTTLPYGAVS